VTGFEADEKMVIAGLMVFSVLIFLMINVRNLYPMVITAIIVLLPLTNMKMMPRSVMGIQGLSALNVVWLAAFVMTVGILIIKRKKLYLADYFVGPILILLCVYFFSALRTFVDLDSLEGVMPGWVMEGKGISTGFFPRLLDDFIKPLQIVLVGWIAMVACHLSDRETVRRTLMVTALVVGAFVVFFFFRGVLETGSFSQARTEISRNFGMHGNSIGRIGVLLFLGLLLVKARDSIVLRLMALAAILMVVGASLSRTSILTLLFTLMLFYRHIEKKERKLVLVMLALAGMLLSGGIIERMQRGFDEEAPVYANQPSESVDLDKISSGRLEKVWAPLLPTMGDHLLFGQGLHGFLKSEAFQEGRIHVLNPHSSYVQLLMDSGLVGMLLVVAMMLILFRQSRVYKNELYYSMIPIMIFGLTGVTFYPELVFYLFFVYYGLHRYDYISDRETRIERRLRTTL